MTARLDNLQTVFDRTDWIEFAQQKRAFSQFAAILGQEKKNPRVKYPEFAEQQDKLIKGLAHWLEALERAAAMDGYQTKEPTR